MPIDKVVKDATNLPDEYVAMVVSYIQFLQFQVNKKTPQTRTLGLLSNRFEFISDDFNEPLEDFREYL